MDSSPQSKTARFVQGSTAPVFRGEPENGLTFLCEQCGHPLIDQYVAEDYIAVGIQCFQCGHVSFTPDIQPGEVFSVKTLAIPQGLYRIGRTVNKYAGMMISGDGTLDARMAETQPAEDSVPFELGFKGLDRLAEIYADVTGGDFEAQRKIVERSPNKFRDSLTFAWSIAILKERLTAKEFDLRDVDACSALIYASTFSSIWGRWRGHPRFNLIAQGFAKPGSFLHTAGLFTTAYIMYQENTPVGLALEDKHGEPNPDLYVRGYQGDRIFLEVKAPKALQTIRDADAIGVVESAVKQTVDRSKAQINRQKSGALVLFATGFRKNLSEEMVRFSNNTLTRVGRQRTSLAAVLTISLSNTTLRFAGKGQGNIDNSFRFAGAANMHFAGENPFKLGA